MSLENKIEQLIDAVNAQTTAINAFNGNIEKWLTAPTETFTAEKVEQVTPSEPVQVEAPEPEQTPTLTHKDVQDAVLAFVREDVKVNKPKVKAILDEFSANKVSDVPESRLAEFNEALGTL